MSREPAGVAEAARSMGGEVAQDDRGVNPAAGLFGVDFEN
jgi:hypothetical protein